MQFNESPLRNKDKVPRYKHFERERMEKALEYEFESREKKVKLFKDFFGCSVEQKTKSGIVHRSETTIELDDEELEDFVVFCKFAIKRIINAQSQKEGGIITKLGEVVYAEGTIELDDEFKLLYHDISHVVGTIVKERHLINDNSIVPPIFEFKPGMSVNNREVMEDELFALIFSTAYTERRNTQLRLNFTKSVLEVVQTYEDFVRVFLKDAIRAIRIANEKEFNLLQGKRKIAFNENYSSITEQQLTEQDQILTDIAKKPPEKLLYLLQYIWNHRDNPRVLVDLFFQEVGPYIEELKKRTPRDIYKDKKGTYDLQPSGNHDTDTQKEQ